MRQIVLILMVLSGLAGCQLALPQGKAAPDDVSPIASDPITVTSLDAPAPAGEASADQPVTPDAAPPAIPAATAPGSAEPPVAGDRAPASETEPAVVAVPKSPAQIACERRKGSWSAIGNGSARTCVMRTRDNGKQCRRETDCEGLCLARSGTCAPVKPMFGCHEILQADGRRVRLCLN